MTNPPGVLVARVGGRAPRASGSPAESGISAADVTEGLAAGTGGYLTRPLDPVEFRDRPRSPVE